mmetsp:Transcript_33009/g.29898  ORF Transcript_33009/g.29898 Transcript_33009/m.29898 type:complete len:142 (-) Transcript_33009:1092-1517(-)
MMQRMNSRKEGGSTMKQIGEIIKYADVFGEPTHLYYNGEYKYRTFMGVVITVILVVTLIAVCEEQISRTFGYAIREVETQQTFLKDPGELYLDTKNFMFALRLFGNDQYSRSLMGLRVKYSNNSEFNNGQYGRRLETNLRL